MIASVPRLAVARELHRPGDQRMRAAGGQADDQRAVIDPAQATEGLLRGAGHDLGPQIEQHQQVTQVAGEEGHLVGPGDQHPVGGHDRVDRRLEVRARQLVGRVLDVDVVGGQRGLELGVIEREQRRRRAERLDPGFIPPTRRRYSSRAACCSSGKPSKPSAWEKRTTVLEDVLARRASSSAVWKAASSRWSTMYCATSFCERENSSKRATMYPDRAWWPWGDSGVRWSRWLASSAGVLFDARRRRSFQIGRDRPQLDPADEVSGRSGRRAERAAGPIGPRRRAAEARLSAWPSARGRPACAPGSACARRAPDRPRRRSGRWRPRRCPGR